MNWTEILRMLNTEVVGSLQNNNIVIVRGDREIVTLRLVGGVYQIAFSIPLTTNAMQITFQGTEHLFMVLNDGQIVILREA